MRLGEIILFALNAYLLLQLIWIPGAGRSRLSKGIVLLSLAAVIFHMILEGARVHMIPVYLLAAVLPFSAWKPHKKANLDGEEKEHAPRKMWKRALITLPTLLFLLGSVGLPSLFRVFRLPEPDGAYAVGTASFHWTDGSRTAALGEDSPKGPREIMAQIWYPADEDGKKLPRPPYVPDLRAVSLAASLPLPPVFYSHLDLVRTHSHLEAPFSDRAASYPVILYSHGMQSNRFMGQFQAEKLASHGYVVVALDHTYYSSGVLFPDERFAEPLAAPNPVRELKAFDEVVDRIWVQDLRFALDKLEAMNRGGHEATLFKGRLDLTRVGVLGYSVGGAAAVHTAKLDDRVKGAVNLDGYPYGTITDWAAAASKPVMYLRGEGTVKETENWASPPDPRELKLQGATEEELRAFRKALGERLDHFLSKGTSVYSIKGTGHPNFSDQELWDPIIPIGNILNGASANPARAHKVINAYTLAFFDKVLYGKTDTLLDKDGTEYSEAVKMK